MWQILKQRPTSLGNNKRTPGKDYVQERLEREKHEQEALSRAISEGMPSSTD